MIKNYFLTSICLIFCVFINAQETVTFSGYDGGNLNITATSTVNDEITIVFEDLNIIDNFYTDGQTEIRMYGGLDTDAGGFQGAPDFNTLADQPLLTLFNDSDVNAGPNTYSITINLATEYSSVPDGTMVYGFNLLFQNQFGGGGNNQSSDLYIDLTDAMKNSTLSTSESQLETIKTFVNNKQLSFSNNDNPINVSVYNILGQNVYTNKVAPNSEVNLSSQPSGIYIVKLNIKNSTRTVKILLD